MDFKKLLEKDVSGWVEKKGKFDYLAWAFAIQILREEEPTATIQARMYEGKPYLDTGNGVMVEFYILLDGAEVWSEFLPVLDFNNKSVKEPNTFELNKAFQRCKAKCIAEYTGAGLTLYRKESAAPTHVKEAAKITIGTDNLADLGKFCLKHDIKTKKAKADFLSHYKIDLYKDTVEEYNNKFEKIQADFNEI